MHASYQPTTTKTYGLGEWRLTVQTDSFTRQTRCRIANRNGVHPDVTVERGALAFHFNPRLDTSEAWYTVDGAPPHAWRDLQAQLLQAGDMAQAERLDNQTGGVVRVPLEEINGAARLTIRSYPTAQPRRIELHQLWATLAAAERLGCSYSARQPSASKGVIR